MIGTFFSSDPWRWGGGVMYPWGGGNGDDVAEDDIVTVVLVAVVVVISMFGTTPNKSSAISEFDFVFLVDSCKTVSSLIGVWGTIWHDIQGENPVRVRGVAIWGTHRWWFPISNEVTFDFGVNGTLWSTHPPGAGDADGVTGLDKPEPNKLGVDGKFGGTRLFISKIETDY